MAPKKRNVAVVGATGAVGREMVAVLAQRRFPVADLRLLASERSVGQRLEFGDAEIAVDVLGPASFAGVEIALFSAGGSVSKEYAPIAASAGAVVVDNTSAFRMEPDVPLVVPEVNPQALAGWRGRRIIANPNCSTIQMVVALKPIHDAVRIRRIVVSTYQAVSGAGQRGIDELERQVRDLFNLREVKRELFPHRIAFNLIPCIPQSNAFGEADTTVEEWKMINETHKILDPSIAVAATCVRVPVFSGHAEAVYLDLERPLAAEQARDLLRRAPGVAVLDDPAKMLFPTPLDATGEDLTLVGRIRGDPSNPNGLWLFVVADNLRKGAALNAVQIA
ncbi:MAG: aspartate-semialdehyde dehydrogenase, partial [Deltaproteobacteria bacterium]|nr:aspartate-semialdehyde dehydrogenase [Deltaproteobacteria bacterium]